VAKEADPKPPHPPGERDLVALCRELNARGAKYVVIGGMAIIQQGLLRTTEDIDLLIGRSAENQQRVRAALETLPDKAVREMGANDLDDYLVVRVIDDIVVDLMLSACGLTYEDAKEEVEILEIEGVPIPFASAGLLLKLKQTIRDKDAIDRKFLEEKLGNEET
jgi:hypothetical protein